MGFPGLVPACQVSSKSNVHSDCLSFQKRVPGTGLLDFGGHFESLRGLPPALFPICELGVPSFPHGEGQEDLPPMCQLNAESQGLGMCVSHTGQYQAPEESPRGQGLSRGSNQHFPQVDWMGEMGTGSWAQGARAWWPEVRPLSWDELTAILSPCPQASGCLSRRPFTVRKLRHREVEGWPSWGVGSPLPISLSSIPSPARGSLSYEPRHLLFPLRGVGHHSPPS